MAWIRVDQSLRQHRKLIALGDELGIDAATAAGHLVFLWLWCLDNAPTGIIKQPSTNSANNAIGNIRLVATACAWSGDPNALVTALLSVGFLNKCGRGGVSLRIHDWYEYAGKLCDARAAHRDRMKRARAGATVRNSTVQNETKENDPTPCSPPFRGTARRRKNGGPLSGKHREKVQH